MRSWRSAMIAIALGACGTSPAPSVIPDPACATSVLTYNNFGAPFMLDWCSGCHASALPAGMRQNAPLGVDFDDLDQVRNFSDMIEASTASAMPTMPPASGPSQEDRALLAEWISCGMQTTPAM